MEKHLPNNSLAELQAVCRYLSIDEAVILSCKDDDSARSLIRNSRAERERAKRQKSGPAVLETDTPDDASSQAEAEGSVEASSGAFGSEVECDSERQVSPLTKDEIMGMNDEDIAAVLYE